MAALLLEKQRRMARSSLYYLAKYVLKFVDVELQPHWELCDFLQKNWQRDCLILLPRGTFKSSITSVSLPIWLFISHSRDLRILLTGGELGNAINFLGLIKQNFESNPSLRLLFGDFSANRRKDTWHSKALSIAGRERLRAEESLTAASYSVSKVSQHYDVAIIDDLQNEKNINTKEQIDECEDYLQIGRAHV